MQKNCYNAGKIGQLPEADYEAKFAAARGEIRALDMAPNCPTQLPHEHERTWLDYMREDLTALLKCDVVYAQRDWQDSRGATIEVNLANALGIPVIYQPD